LVNFRVDNYQRGRELTDVNSLFYVRHPRGSSQVMRRVNGVRDNI